MTEPPTSQPSPARRRAANALAAVTVLVAVGAGSIAAAVIVVAFVLGCFGPLDVGLTITSDVAATVVLVLLAVIGRLRLLGRPIGGRMKRVTVGLTFVALVFAAGAAYTRPYCSELWT